MGNFTACRLRYNAALAGTLYLHFLFWGSLVTLFTSFYLLANSLSDTVLIPCSALLLLASFLALAYAFFLQMISRKRKLVRDGTEQPSSIRRPVYIATRLAIVVVSSWFLSSGWNLTTAARQPLCLPTNPALDLWQAGPSCRAQRVATAFSMLNLLSSCAIFFHMATSTDPIGSHLFGQDKERLSTITPYSSTWGSREKELLPYKRTVSGTSTLPEKPPPKAPTARNRPLTPMTTAIGLGIFTQSDVAVDPPISHVSTSSPRTPNLERKISQSHYAQRNASSTDLPGSISPLSIRRPPPSLPPDSPLRVAPLAYHSRNVANTSPASSRPHTASSRPPTSGSRPPTSNGRGRKRLVLHPSQGGHLRSPSQNPSIISNSYSLRHGHPRSHSLPYTPTIPASRSSSVGSSHRRLVGHTRCASDPNEIINAHLVAEMELAMRLEQKLLEVEHRVEKGKGKRSSQESSFTAREHSSQAVGEMKSGAEGWGGADLSGSPNKRSSTQSKRVQQKRESSLFAKVEWDILMGIREAFLR